MIKIIITLILLIILINWKINFSSQHLVTPAPSATDWHHVSPPSSGKNWHLVSPPPSINSNDIPTPNAAENNRRKLLDQPLLDNRKGGVEIDCENLCGIRDDRLIPQAMRRKKTRGIGSDPMERVNTEYIGLKFK